MKKIILSLALASVLLLGCNGKKESEKEVTNAIEKKATEVNDKIKPKPQKMKKQITTSFEVDGKGEMSKSLIEKAAKSVAGVTKAEWNMENKVLEVSAFDNVDWNLVVHAVVKEGFDSKYNNEKYMAKVEDYKELPENCRYRTASLKEKGKVTSKKKSRKG